MAAALSQHSSNPFEVSSSDPRQRVYRRRIQQVQRANRAAQAHHHASSDDPLNSLNVPELDNYHAHLADLYPQNATLATLPSKMDVRREEETVSGMVDLDEDMSDDELYLVPNPPKPQARYASKYEDACIVDDDEDFGDPPGNEDNDGNDNEDNDDDDEEEDEDQDEDQDEDADEDDASSTPTSAFSEERSLYFKPPDEQAEIASEIIALTAALPTLAEDYRLLDRLGTGTFSSVYKALDLHYHTKWDNALWHGAHPPSSSAHYQSAPRAPGERVYVAIKRIYVTSGPERIRNEIAIMESCRGCRHVSQLITAFRHEDQVVAIMPYHRNEDFRDFYKTLSMDGIKAYFRCMFRALRDIHARGVIHRDVKPANFLFDPHTGIGTLCDFGLACRMEPGPTLGACLHTGPTVDHPHGLIRPKEEYDAEQVKRAQREGRVKNSWPSDRVGYLTKDHRPHSKANRAGTRGFRAPEVLLKCGEQTGAIDVWSAGTILLFFLTGKFPLFQSSDDVEALMEIAAILGQRRMEKTATLHSRVFQTNIPTLSPDGITWREFVQRQNPDLYKPKCDPKPLRRTVAPADTKDSAHMDEDGASGMAAGHSPARPPPTSSSPDLLHPRFSPSRDSLSPAPAAPSADEAAALARHKKDVDQALDLLTHLMHPESVRRLTPRRALYHPFLLEEPGDDAFVPHAHGGGVCGEWHEWDEETDEMIVRVRVRRKVKGKDGEEVERDEWVRRRVVPGEAVAIGHNPCEFHKVEDGYVYD